MSSQIGSLRALCGSLLAFTTIACGLRFYARHVQQARLGADDWIVLPAYVCFVGMVVCMLLGINLHYWGSTDQQVEAAHISFYVEVSLIVAMDLFSTAALGFTRISALLFYRRIFALRGHSPTFRSILHVTIGIVALWMAAFIILPPLQCGPDLSVWAASPAVRATKCTMGAKLGLGVSISDLILEIWVIALPVPCILTLRITWKRRVAVLFIFLTAFVSFGAVAARLGITYRQLYGHSTDKTQINTSSYFIWTLEAGFALIAVNLPSLWWIRHKVRPESILAGVRSVLSLQSIRSRVGASKASQDRNAGIAGPIGKASRDRPEASQRGTESLEKLAEDDAEEMSELHERASDKRSEEDSARVNYLPGEAR
ncbi:MAG: hypothetical protein LQ340_000777 [Diploschistes diacapsis]|nr:MAG: hypothetical protein LQ340_000777 [Diploschistes diacapsis]